MVRRNSDCPKRRRARAPRATALALLAFLPFGFMSSGVAAEGTGVATTNDTRIADPLTVGSTVSGAYLAGRHAQLVRDPEAANRYLTEVLKSDPDNPALLNRAFQVLLADGRVMEALPLAERVAAHNEDALFAVLTLAAEDMRQGRFAAAQTRIENIPENGFTDLLKPLLSAWALAGQGKTDEALQRLNALNGKQGFDIFAAIHGAFINDVAGRTKAAQAAFEKAASMQKEISFRFVTLYGGFLERNGKASQAATLYKDFLAKNSGTPAFADALSGPARQGGKPREIASAQDGASDALFDLASALGRSRTSEPSLLLGVLSLHLRPGFTHAEVLIAELMEAQGRLKRANDFYGAVPATSPFWPTVQLRIANNLDEMKDFDQAAAHLRELAAKRPDDPEPLVELGRILHRHEKYQDAVAAFDDAFKRLNGGTTRDWRLYYSRGMALERAGNWPRAEADFQKALEIEPEQPYVLNYLGYSWVDQGLHLDQARKMIEKAVELRPTDGFIVDSLGWVNYMTGDYAGAVTELERAVELRPQDPTINDHLGDAYWRVGRRDEARFQWRRSLSFNPEAKDREKIENKLKNGLTEPAHVKTDG